MAGLGDAQGIPYKGTGDVLVRLYNEPGPDGRPLGVKSMFKGVGPRVMWMGIGGLVFFGAYEGCKSNLQKMKSKSRASL
jgi:solute carrier family 25 S-adenosylmethionine transporter 26